MPFRIRVTIAVLCTLLALLVIGPLLVPVPPLEGLEPPRALAGPEDRFVRADGAELRVRVAEGAGEGGGGVPVVLLHGYPANARAFDAFAAGLAAREGIGPVAAFDRPGFGLSERPERGAWSGADENPYGAAAAARQTVGVLDALGFERALLVGHGAGAAVALRVAREAPERVAGLALLDPALITLGGAPAWSRPLLFTPQLSRIGPLLVRQLGGAPGESLLGAAWADPDAVPPEAVEAYRETFRVEGWDRALFEHARAPRDRPLPDDPERAARALAGLVPPVLVATGAEDPVVAPEESRLLVDALPGAAFVALPGCGHVPHQECPEALTDALAAWWSDAGGEAGGGAADR